MVIYGESHWHVSTPMGRILEARMADESGTNPKAGGTSE
jgi:hypothetical protein